MYKDFLRGSLVLMPTPSMGHESVKEYIARQIGNYFDDSPHKVFTGLSVAMSPYLPKIKDLKAFQKHFKKHITKGTEQETYLVPDIFVALNADNQKDDNSYGYIKIPKLVIEILSDSTAVKDLGDKKELYRYIGVEEYWVVSSVKNVSVFLLENGEYEETTYSLEDEEMEGIEYLEIPVSVFPDLKIKIKE
jgi:Uma2 family endonuclease